MNDVTTDTTADAGDAAAQAAAWTADDVVSLVRSASRLGLSAEIVTDLRDKGVSPAAAKDALIDAKAVADEKIVTRSYISGGIDHSDPAAIRQRMSAAVLNRVDPQRFPLADQAREFRGMSLLDLKRELMESRGIRTRGWTRDELFQRGDIGAVHTTSDFAWLLGDVMHKTLEAHLAEATSPLKNHSKEKTAVDFREMHIARGGTASALEKVSEAAEFKRGTWQGETEKCQLATYGKVFAVSRQVIVNDSLDFFSGIAGEAALAVSALESEAFVQLLVANSGAGVTMADGLALFHNNHKNLGTASVPDIDALSEARQLLRAQKGAGGLHLIGATPAAILVPSSLETVAEQLVASITAASVGEVNPFAGKLAVEVDPCLDAHSTQRWYVFAAAPALVHAYLNGNRTADISTRLGFDVDGVEWRIRHDFAATALDYRLVVSNPGAAS